MPKINVTVDVDSNSDLFKEALPEQIEKALIAIGLTAEGHAKDICPVDTGRLRNSISNAVDTQDQSVVIGTNVEYAPNVELGTSRQKAQPYLRPAVTNYGDEYKQLAEVALKGS